MNRTKYIKRLTAVILVLIAMNANAQWVQYTLPYYGYAYTLGFYDINNGISFGHTLFPFNEKLYYTTNSGDNWQMAGYPLQLRAIADVQYINASTIYAGGSENISFDYNNYNSFKSYPLMRRAKLIYEGKGDALIPEYKSAFIKSTDGGVNWQKIGEFDTLTGYINDIQFFDANTGYALIDSTMYGKTMFYKTTNAGINWNFITRVDTAEIDRMIFFNINTGIAKGFSSGGRIYRTTNAGANWTIKEMPSQIDCIAFFNSSTGLAMGITETGVNTKVYKTTDGGIQWNVISTIPLVQYQNLKIRVNTGTGFAVGNVFDTATFTYGRITTLKTTDYGVSWTGNEFNPSMLMFGLEMTDGNNYFISGGDINGPALILKSTNGGNVFVNNSGREIPSYYSLGQNYPNPFNSLTVISYQLLVVSDVSLKVYNLQGREVQVLVNGRMQPGVYEVSFDGSMLSSGVYFYRMEADGYIETRRMLLLK